MLHHLEGLAIFILYINVFHDGTVLEVWITYVKGRVYMQKLIKAFENMMVAITFAEAGEYDEAQRLSNQDPKEEATEETATIGIRTNKA